MSINNNNNNNLLIALMIIVSIIAIILLVKYFLQRTDVKSLKDQVQNTNQRYDEIYHRFQEILTEAKDYQERYHDQVRQTAELHEALETKNAELLSSYEEVTDLKINQNDQERIKEFDAALSSRQSDLDHLNEMVAAKRVSLDELEDKFKILLSERDEVGKEKEECTQEITELADRLTELRNLKLDLESQLESLKLTSRAALCTDLPEEGVGSPQGVTFTLNYRDRHLMEVLESIKKDYPELMYEFGGIEWRKIWLPKIQDLCNRESSHLIGVGGIYKITWLEDESICYVGKTTDFKKRWYEHIGKMVGAHERGNEKLYVDEEGNNRTPDKFRWQVLEEIPKEEMNNEVLSNKEHFWIEYFGCKERGLNRKA